MKNIKKTIALFTLLFLFGSAATFAQEDSKFKEIKRLKTTSVKDQNRSGTCWSFSTISFIESEMLRMGKGEADLSEMYIVNKVYSDKAEKYVRLHGNLSFSGGGAIHDVFNMIKKYGIVPEEVYKGLNYGEDNHAHGEIDEVLKAYVEAVVKNKNKKLTPVWHKGFDAVLSAYFGEIPQKFNYQGKEYTPRTFADQVVGINPNDYVQFSSYTHHPFYDKFILEVPDNWAWGEFFNIPIEDLQKIFSNAIDNGYTLAWASDVSEKGFAFRNGYAYVPAVDYEETSGSERARWEKLSEEERNKEIKSNKGKKITQEMRQHDFDNYLTTDDHGMHIVGKAKDQNDVLYYIVKNSWAESNLYKGYFYASEDFILFKTMCVLVHKNAVPKDILKKIEDKTGIKF